MKYLITVLFFWSSASFGEFNFGLASGTESGVGAFVNHTADINGLLFGVGVFGSDKENSFDFSIGKRMGKSRLLLGISQIFYAESKTGAVDVYGIQVSDRSSGDGYGVFLEYRKGIFFARATQRTIEYDYYGEAVVVLSDPNNPILVGTSSSEKSRDTNIAIGVGFRFN